MTEIKDGKNCTTCPTCGCPCTIGGEHSTHFYIPHPGLREANYDTEQIAFYLGWKTRDREMSREQASEWFNANWPDDSGMTGHERSVLEAQKGEHENT